MLIFEGQQQNTSILIQTFVETFNKELEKLLFNSLFTGEGEGGPAGPQALSY